MVHERITIDPKIMFGKPVIEGTRIKDFGELVIRLGLPAYGIVLLRINPADSATKLVRMQVILQKDASRLPGSLLCAGPGPLPVRASENCAEAGGSCPA